MLMYMYHWCNQNCALLTCYWGWNKISYLFITRSCLTWFRRAMLLRQLMGRHLSTPCPVSSLVRAGRCNSTTPWHFSCSCPCPIVPYALPRFETSDKTDWKTVSLCRNIQTGYSGLADTVCICISAPYAFLWHSLCNVCSSLKTKQFLRGVLNILY